MTDHCDVFLSYSRNDLDAATNLRGQLDRHGLAVFRDQESIREGDVWLSRLQEAVDACGSFIVLVGRDGAGRWIGAETQVALSRYFGPHDDAERLFSAGSDGWLRAWDSVTPGQFAGALPNADRLHWQGTVLSGVHDAGGWVRSAAGIRHFEHPVGKVESYRFGTAVANRDGSVFAVRHDLDGKTIGKKFPHAAAVCGHGPLRSAGKAAGSPSHGGQSIGTRVKARFPCGAETVTKWFGSAACRGHPTRWLSSKKNFWRPAATTRLPFGTWRIPSR